MAKEKKIKTYQYKNIHGSEININGIKVLKDEYYQTEEKPTNEIKNLLSNKYIEEIVEDVEEKKENGNE